MLRDIVRFYRESLELLEDEDEGPSVTLGDYLEQKNDAEVLDRAFREASKRLARFDAPFMRMRSTDAAKKFPDGSLDFVYTHLAFPEMQREEFAPVTDAQLANDHHDRVAMTAIKQTSPETSWLGVLGAWEIGRAHV